MDMSRRKIKRNMGILKNNVIVVWLEKSIEKGREV